MDPKHYSYVVCAAVKFGRCLPKFRDKVLRFQIPARSVEPSIGLCPKMRHSIGEDHNNHLNVNEIKIISIFFLS
jgi:hypothetical protein